MTNEERAHLTGTFASISKNQVVSLNVSELPASIDWRQKGAVTPVQNQGNCGSCWAFSAVAAMESAHFIKSGSLIKLSEQQCLDCARKNGCAGGYQEDCFSYAEEGEKMNTEAEYPYTSWADECWP